MYLDVN